MISKHSGTISVITLSTTLVLLMLVWMGFNLVDLPRQLLGNHFGDIHLNSWFVYQAIDNLLNHPGDLGHSGMYYGEPASFAYSIAPYGIAVIVLPLYILSGSNLELTYNLYFIATYILTAWATYLLVDYLFKPRAAISVLCGLMLTFAQFRMLHFVHIETLSTHSFLLALYCLHRLLDDRQWRWSLGLAISFWFTITTSGSLGMAFVVIGAVVILFALIKRRRAFTLQLLAQFAVCGLLVLAMLWPFVSFRKNNPAFARGYSLDEIAFYSANPMGWLSGTSFLYSRITPFLEENTVFIGIIPLVLAFIAWRARKHAPDQAQDRLFSTRELVTLYTTITLIGFLFSLGPEAKISSAAAIPLPYSLLVNLPGFASVRACARYIWLATVGTTVLSAYALTYFAVHKTHFYRLFALITLGLAIELLPARGNADHPLYFKTQHINLEMSAYDWLKQQPEETPIAEYPFGGELAVWYVHAQRYHQQPILNGWGSFIPDWQYGLNKDNLASDASLDFLRQRHIQYIFVHNELLGEVGRAQLKANVERFVQAGKITFFRSFGTVDVYKLK